MRPREAHAQEPLEERVEQLRQRLLDLTKKNPLLNLKHSERSRRQIRIIDEVPEFLLQKLVTGKSFRIKAVARPDSKAVPEVSWQVAARAEGLNPTYDLPRAPAFGDMLAKHSDSFIQVAGYQDVAVKSLEGIRTTHQTLLKDSGIPALFIAFGFLEWRETDKDATALQAPLILLRLELDRTKRGYRWEYKVTAPADEPPEMNLVLALRLRQFGIELPSLSDDVEGFDVGAVLEDVGRRVADMSGWSVKRQATIGIFQFARQVMYEDLDPQRWNARGGRAGHPTVQAVFGEGGPQGEVTMSRATAEEIVERSLITDADSSQREAVVQAVHGNHMVVRGPPGTGKSQTITNIIASALAAKKTVLFLAEKMAALDVVKKRLDDTGVGRFCLELHSNKTSKHAIYQDLDKCARARDEPHPRPRTNSTREERRAIAESVEAYDAAMATIVGALGLSLGELVWRMAALRKKLGAMPQLLEKIELRSAVGLTAADLTRDRLVLDQLERAWCNVADPEGRTSLHAWRHARRPSLTRAEQDRLVGIIRDWRQVLDEAIQLTARSGDLGIRCLQESSPLATRLAALPEVAGFEGEAVARLANPEDWKRAAAFVADFSRWRSAFFKVSNFTSDPQRTISGSISAIRVAVAGHATSGWTLGQLAAFASDRRRMLEGVGDALDALDGVRQALIPFGGPDVVNRSIVTVLEQVVRLFRVAPPGARQLRPRVIRSAGALARAQAPCQQGRELRDLAAAMDQEYRARRDVASARYWQAAIALRGAGFLGRWLSGAVRDARRLYAGLTVGRRADPEAMAKLFEAIARHLDAERDWLAGPERHELFEGHDHGFNTDFDAVALTLAWAESVWQAAPTDAREHRLVRALLFTAPVELIERIGDVAGRIASATERWFGEHPELDLRAWHARSNDRLIPVEEALRASDDLKLDGRTPLGDLEALEDAIRIAKESAARMARNQEAIGVLAGLWTGADTHLETLEKVLSLRRQLEEVGLPEGLTRHLLEEDTPHRWSEWRACGMVWCGVLEREARARTQAAELGWAGETVWPAGAPFGTVSPALDAALATTEHLGSWIAFISARERASAHAGIRDLLAGVDWSQVPLDHLSDVYELAVYRSLCTHAEKSVPVVMDPAATGRSLAVAIERYAQLDRELLVQQRQVLIAEVSARPVPPGVMGRRGVEATDLALIRREAEKQKRHLPLRALLTRARTAVQAIKPCFMMSPLSVAQYLDDPSFQFDLLVIDEASQMRPEDALGAVLRARQVIVVGDKEQLPPSAFFDRLASDEEAADDAYDKETGIASILDEMNHRVGLVLDLLWHYRSRHDSLVRFSNENFYDGQLQVFPSPSARTEAMGATRRLVAGSYSGGINRAEAEIVVQATLEHMRRHPDRSLLVVAMNQKQADLISELLDQKLVRDDSGFVERWRDTLSPFLVKNLENVQGDERDAIFISLTYGPDDSGKVLHKFGPINGINGYRRLNVLFTRAKTQLVVFTSMRSDHLRSGDAERSGVRVLRDYLQYLEDTGRPRESDHSIDLAAASPPVRYLATEMAAYDLRPGVDLGQGKVVLPLAIEGRTAGEYACGIDVDGGSPELAMTDRLRLRPEMLRSLGWNVIQSWTSEWLQDRTSAERMLLHAVEHAIGLPLARRSAENTDRRAGSQGRPVDAPAISPPREGGPRAAPRHAIVEMLARHEAFAGVDLGRHERALLAVDLLLGHGNHAAFEALAVPLGVPVHRVQGAVANLGVHLSRLGAPVVRSDVTRRVVELDVPLIEALLQESGGS